MHLEPALVMQTAAFTPAIFEPADRRGYGNPNPSIGLGYVHGSGTLVLDEVPEDPLRKYLAEAAAQRQLQYRIEAQIEDRLRELLVDAQVEGEAFSEASVADLRQFLGSVGVTKRPAIFLLDSGNIRALWRDVEGQQVGLQFLGGGRVQFVIFSIREDPRMMMRVAGVDSIVEMGARVARDRVNHLLVE